MKLAMVLVVLDTDRCSEIDSYVSSRICVVVVVGMLCRSVLCRVSAC